MRVDDTIRTGREKQHIGTTDQITAGVGAERSLLKPTISATAEGAQRQNMKNPETTSDTKATEAAGMPQPLIPQTAAGGAGVGAASGAAAGAAIGAFAGPPGIVAGALIGAVAGAATGAALADDHDADDEDKKLDEEIGVTAGDIGAATPGSPPASRGTYSGGAAGAGTIGDSDDAPSEGPMPHGD